MKIGIDRDLIKKRYTFNHGTGELIKRNGKPVISRSHEGYVVVRISKKLLYAHRVIWTLVVGDIPEGMVLDHINGVKSDNRISNLRLCNDFENSQNYVKPNKNNKSGFLGVSFHSTSKLFVATIKVRGKRFDLGYFKDPKDAHLKYLEAKRRGL